MENYIVINGKKSELTKEQLEKLGIKVEKKNPFERLHANYYSYIDGNGYVCEDTDEEFRIDEERYCVANYCRDKKMMQQRALHETLDRLLWRFSCENGELENPWDGENRHWCIVCYTKAKNFCPACMFFSKINEPHFPSEEIAQRAIDEIVIPFMEKHPDFVW